MAFTDKQRRARWPLTPEQRFWKQVPDRPEGAHIFSLDHFGEGRTLDRPIACHHCDNRPCVRPSHIYAGTMKTNARDMVLRDRHPGIVNSHGETNYNAKLTAAQVVAIRARYASGGISQASLAREYGVAQQTVSACMNGQNWPSLDRP